MKVFGTIEICIILNSGNALPIWNASIHERADWHSIYSYWRKSGKIRESAKRYIFKCIDFAEEFGAEVVGGPFYSAAGRLQPSEKIEKERERVIYGLREVGDYVGWDCKCH